MTLDYKYKTEPLAHQQEFLERTAHLPIHAMFWEQGCGKTKSMIDNIAYLYEQKEIDGALIVAPNGVDINWELDEIPIHLPDSVKKQSRIWRFSTKKSGAKWHKEQVKWNREHAGLAWLLMSYDAFMTDEGKDAALFFLEQRKCFYLLDESVSIKTPGAKRTMRITRTAWRAKYRRILDGYPTPKGAFDLYPQIKFLDEDFWKQHHWDDASMFRGHFGLYEEAKTNYKTKAEYKVLLGYQNLEELNKIIAPISSRLMKKDVLDLPPKIYQPRYFELAPAQRKIYDQLRDEYKIWLDQETLVTANLAMVRMLRLQQISCGYLPVGEDEPVHRIEGKNPRADLMEDLIDKSDEKTIIWARYQLDIKLIEDLMRTKNSQNFVTYTGETEDDDRIAAKESFQRGDAQFFIGTPAAAGIGLTLHAAHNVIYYSNSFNLRHRVQSEDRAHRVGLTHSVNYIDLLGLDTIDKQIMLNLTGKMNTTDAILGDTPGHDLRSQIKSWLNNEAC